MIPILKKTILIAYSAINDTLPLFMSWKAEQVLSG